VYYSIVKSFLSQTKNRNKRKCKIIFHEGYHYSTMVEIAHCICSCFWFCKIACSSRQASHDETAMPFRFQDVIMNSWILFSRNCVIVNFFILYLEIMVFALKKIVLTLRNKLLMNAESQQVLGWFMWGIALWHHDEYQITQNQVQSCCCCKKSSLMWGCLWEI
jgi:hypothetical protein